MAIDAMMLDPMLGTFKNMMVEIDEKGITGEHTDLMRESLSRMEALGQEHSDFNAFNADLMKENLFAKFSDGYGKALGQAASTGSGGDSGEYDDGALLKQTLDALRGAIQTLKDAKQAAIDESNSYDAGATAAAGMDFVKRNKALFGMENLSDRQMDGMKAQSVDEAVQDQKQNPGKFSSAVEIEALCVNETLIEGIQNVIKLGEEEGMTFPRFLRIQIEKGLDKAMEGSHVLLDGLAYSKGFIEANGNQPYHLAEINAKIEAYKALAARSPFHVPDQLEFQFIREGIEREFEPQKIKYDWIESKWEQIIDYLDTWVKSHTKYAPYMDPWKMIQDPAAKQRAIERSQECSQGEMKVVEAIFDDYFQLSFGDVWSHETFVNKVNSSHLWWSQEYLTFLRDKVYPECVPFQKPSAETIAECERLYDEKRMQNPHVHLPSLRSRDHYNATFGEGRFEERFGAPASPPETNAAPWDLGTF